MGLIRFVFFFFFFFFFFSYPVLVCCCCCCLQVSDFLMYLLAHFIMSFAFVSTISYVFFSPQYHLLCVVPGVGLYVIFHQKYWLTNCHCHCREIIAEFSNICWCFCQKIILQYNPTYHNRWEFGSLEYFIQVQFSGFSWWKYRQPCTFWLWWLFLKLSWK